MIISDLLSAIRYFSENGQSSDNSLENFNENGFPLLDGYIEVIQPEDPLAGDSDENVGKIKLYTWRGHNYVGNTETDLQGWMDSCRKLVAISKTNICNTKFCWLCFGSLNFL